jgi:hypothetical protein
MHARVSVAEPTAGAGIHACVRRLPL